MRNIYDLRLFDDTLITFSLEEKGLEGLQADILSTDNPVSPAIRPSIFRRSA
jgi:hypothetical protein